MKEFFDPENYNKLESIIVSNIQQHPNYDSSIQIKDILKKNMMDIYNAYKKTYESMSISDQILQYNSNTIRESIPKLIEILNNKKEDKTASAIDKYINQKLIPEIEVKMNPEYMDPNIRNNIDLNKLYEDTTQSNFNNRNSLKVENNNGLEPKDLYRENTKVKEVLQEKQINELNSNQDILDITTKIYNETSKGMDRYMEEYITISSLDRNTTNYPFLTDSKFVVEFNVDNNYSGASIGRLFKNVISIELLNVNIPLLFKTSDDATYGISSYSPLLATGSGTVNSGTDPVTNDALTILPYIYLSIEEFNDKNYNTSTNPVYSKLIKIGKNGSSASLEPTDGKKIFRRTELKNINRLTFEFLQPDGTPFIFLYGNRTSNNYQVANSSLPETAVSLDFKLTILEPSFENIN